MVYAYRCKACDDRFDGVDPEPPETHLRVGRRIEELPDEYEAAVLCRGPIVRVWSFGISWPKDQRGH